MGSNFNSRSNTTSGTASLQEIGRRRVIRAKRPKINGSIENNNNDEDERMTRKRTLEVPTLAQLALEDSTKSNLQANKRLRQDQTNISVRRFTYTNDQVVNSNSQGQDGFHLASTPPMNNLSSATTNTRFTPAVAATATATTAAAAPVPINHAKPGLKRFKGTAPPPPPATPVYPPSVQSKMDTRDKVTQKIQDYQRRITDLNQALVDARLPLHKRPRMGIASATALPSSVVQTTGMMAKRDKFTQKMQRYQQHAAGLTMEINMELYGTYFHSSPY